MRTLACYSLVSYPCFELFQYLEWLREVKIIQKPVRNIPDYNEYDHSLGLVLLFCRVFFPLVYPFLFLFLKFILTKEDALRSKAEQLEKDDIKRQADSESAALKEKKKEVMARA